MPALTELQPPDQLRYHRQCLGPGRVQWRWQHKLPRSLALPSHIGQRWAPLEGQVPESQPWHRRRVDEAGFALDGMRKNPGAWPGFLEGCLPSCGRGRHAAARGERHPWPHALHVDRWGSTRLTFGPPGTAVVALLGVPAPSDGSAARPTRHTRCRAGLFTLQWAASPFVTGSHGLDFPTPPVAGEFTLGPHRSARARLVLIESPPLPRPGATQCIEVQRFPT